MPYYILYSDRIQHGQNQRGITSVILSSVYSLHRFSQKLASLRQEADTAVDRAEVAEAKNKKYEQEILEKDAQITSLTHNLSILDANLEKAEAKVSDSKVVLQESEVSKSTNEALTRKVQLLEEELDAAEKNVKETMEKWVICSSQWSAEIYLSPLWSARLRQVDVKAEHFERQVQRIEQERDMWEKKYEVRPNTAAITHIKLFYCVLYRTLKRNIASPRQN